MKFWVGVTNNSWYTFLAEEKPSIINFWQPSGTVAFKVIQPGAPFLFKLHSPVNAVSGGAIFVEYRSMTVREAWKKFEEGNGAPYPEEFYKFFKYDLKKGNTSPSKKMIGCCILESPFFFRPEEWIPQPENWSPNIVRGKSYETSEYHGKKLWTEVERRQMYAIAESTTEPAWVVKEPEGPRYGTEYITQARLGQVAFRSSVALAYGNRCAITGEGVLPVLDAAHIRPYANGGPHKLPNGLLLRRDLHCLLDRGLITILPDYQVRVSPALRDLYGTSLSYASISGLRLAVLPQRHSERPGREFLEWHYDTVFIK